MANVTKFIYKGQEYTITGDTSTCIPRDGDRGNLSGYESVTVYTDSAITVNYSSPDTIIWQTPGEVTLTLEAADSTYTATKIICLYASVESTLSLDGTYTWVNDQSAPEWGDANSTLILTAHFINGSVLLSVYHNSMCSMSYLEEMAENILSIKEQIDNGMWSATPLTVQAPTNLFPGSENASLNPTFSADPYNSLIPSDGRAYRVFQVTTADDPDYLTPIIDTGTTVTTNSYTPDYNSIGYFSEGTDYIWRCRDVSQWGIQSNFGTAEFTTIAEAGIVTPTLSVEGAPNQVIEDPTLTAGEFEIVGVAETHVSTDWSIETTDGTVVWSSTSDTTNLYSITLDKGILSNNTDYVFKVRFNSASYSSDYATVEASTKVNFVTVSTPTVFITGSPDNVNRDPTISCSPFAVTATYTDTHASTEYQILRVSDSEVVWSKTSTEDSELIAVYVPVGYLTESTNYTVRVRQTGNTYGDSEWGELSFTTRSEFTHIEAPTLTVSDTSDIPVISGTAFTVVTSTGQTDTHKMSDWEVYKTEDNTLVWASLDDTENLTSIRVPEEYLEVSTEYTYRCRYIGENYTSEWSTVSETTAEEFFLHIDPEIIILNTSDENMESNLVDIPTVFEATGYDCCLELGCTLGEQSWELYLATDTAFENPVYTFTENCVLVFYPNFTPDPDTEYVLRYRYQNADSSAWSNYVYYSFKTVEELNFPTIKFTMKTSVTLSSCTTWWNANTLSVYRNGVYDETLTTGYSSAQTLSDEGDEIEIVASNRIYPLVSFYGQTNLLSINAPLPQMRYTESGDPITYFQRSSTSSNSIHCMCYNCTSLESIPDFMWIFNPALLYMGTYSTQTGEAYNRGSFQNCTSLKELPAHLFYNLYNLTTMGNYGSQTGASTVAGPFRGCTSLTELPDGLFSHLPSLTALQPKTAYYYNMSYNGVFYECTGLTKIGKLFKNLPSLLYIGWNTNDTNYITQGMFRDCVNLAEAPEDLFENLPSVVSIRFFFYNCASFVTPVLSFKGTPNVSRTTENFTGIGIEYITIRAPAGSSTASSFSAWSNVIVEEI